MPRPFVSVALIDGRFVYGSAVSTSSLVLRDALRAAVDNWVERVLEPTIESNNRDEVAAIPQPRIEIRSM